MEKTVGAQVTSLNEWRVGYEDALAQAEDVEESEEGVGEEDEEAGEEAGEEEEAQSEGETADNTELSDLALAN